MKIQDMDTHRLHNNVHSLFHTEFRDLLLNKWLVVVCIAAVAAFGQQRKLNSADDYIKRGLTHYENRDYDKAIEDATAAIRLDPNGWKAYFLRADTYKKRGNYDKAIEDYTVLIRLRTDFATAYNSRAWIYAWDLKKEFDRAIADATQAIKLEPKNASYYDTRGWAYFGKGDYNRANDDFFMALKFDPNENSSKEGLKKIREVQGASSATNNKNITMKGYDQVEWGTSVDAVRKAYNLGNNFVLQENYDNDPNVAVLIQKNVSESIKQRVFMFNKWKGNYQLYRVWVTYFDASNGTVQNLLTGLENKFGERTDFNKESKHQFNNWYVYRETSTFGKYSPELVVELVHIYTNYPASNSSGLVITDNSGNVVMNLGSKDVGIDIGDSPLEICYTWKKFRDAYKSRNVEF